MFGIILASYTLKEEFLDGTSTIKRSNLAIVTIIGLFNGFLIGMITNYYTSYEYRPV